MDRLPTVRAGRQSMALAVTEPSQVGEARRTVTALAGRLGWDETDAGRAAIVVTELATNVLKHGGHGELLVRVVDGTGLELLALDRGPGISDVARVSRDGYSTAGSAGAGIGAVERLAAGIDIYSVGGEGTAVLARVRPRDAAPVSAALQVGAVCVAKPGEQACGDSWYLGVAADGTATLTVADGLGHGPAAAEASAEAVRVAEERSGEGPAALLAAQHAALRPTRGAAVAVAALRPTAGTIAFSGVGNVAGAVVTTAGSKSMMSHNGIVGHEARKIQELDYPWPAGALVVLSSDGLATRWDLGRYPGLVGRDPALVAGVLYRDFGRRRDDCTVVVVRDAGGAG